jgi:sugar (pentulose or hexulose) kinase
MAWLLGIDKGTSVIKAVVFDDAGRQVAAAQRRVEVLRPRPGWHEEDPQRTWTDCAAAIREAVAAAGIAPDAIAGVGIAAHMGGAWLVDAAGTPIRNAICWPDERAQADQLALERAGVLPETFAISGNGLMPGITLLLLSWLGRNEPETRARTAHVLCAKDYLRLRLTGQVATDPSDVCFVPGDVRRLEFSPRLMELCGAADWLDRMPPILPSGAVAGTVTAAAAAETGLAAGTPVVTGLGDACANALGAGTIRPGDALTVLGTSCLNTLILDAPDSAPEGLGFLFAMPMGRYARILPNTSGTIAMDWYLDRFGPASAPDGRPDFAALEARAAAVPRGAQGTMLLPFVNGAGMLAPQFDPLARGAFFGLSGQTTPDHLLRAVYEALCLATRDCLLAMPQRPGTLVLTGGGARSAFWAQMFADVCGLPVRTVEVAESGALGVALLAGVAAGLWPDLDAAVAATARTAAEYRPDPQAAADYDGWYDLYAQARAVYGAHSAARAALAAEGVA